MGKVSLFLWASLEELREPKRKECVLPRAKSFYLCELDLGGDVCFLQSASEEKEHFRVWVFF